MEHYVYGKYLKLKDWIPVEKIDWCELSANLNAIPLLEKNIEKINWKQLSQNPNAIHFFAENAKN